MRNRTGLDDLRITGARQNLSAAYRYIPQIVGFGTTDRGKPLIFKLPKNPPFGVVAATGLASFSNAVGITTRISLEVVLAMSPGGLLEIDTQDPILSPVLIFLNRDYVRQQIDEIRMGH